MSESKVTQRARGKWKGVLTQLGVNERILDGKHHPCPRSGEGEDRFRFSNKDGKGNFFCACNDGRSDGFKLLECMFGWEFKEAAERVEELVGDAAEDEEQRRSKEHALRDLRGIQSAVRKTASDASTRAYLASRGIDLSAVYSPGVLHDADIGYGLKAIGITGLQRAMVAKVVTKDGKPSTYHITYLDESNRKASHKRNRVVATPVADMAGGAVRLAPFVDGVLGVAEGIETAYSAMQLFGIPVWATLNAQQMEKFVPPDGCSELVIFGDKDASFTGQAAAYTLAKRAKLRYGIGKIEVRIPSKIDTDFNDVLREGSGRG